MENQSLTGQEIQEIEEQAQKKAEEYHKNSIIGEQVFDILKKNCRLLFYPLDDESIWGFYEKKQDYSFICINSSIDFDKQIFAAAHELYHLWFNKPNTLILESDIYEQTQNISKDEIKANRFAAAFLVPEDLLEAEIVQHNINKSDIHLKDCVKLARIFFVPYRAIVKRLHELNYINAGQEEDFLTIQEGDIKILQKRLGLELLQKTNTVSLDVLVDKSLLAYEQKQITKDKLDYLLSLAHTNSSEFGIKDDSSYKKPSLEELNAISEE